MFDSVESFPKFLAWVAAFNETFEEEAEDVFEVMGIRILEPEPSNLSCYEAVKNRIRVCRHSWDI